MGGREWTEEETNDLAILSTDEFMLKWRRTQVAIYSRRSSLGIVLLSDRPKGHIDKKSLCVYCSTRSGKCTCKDGDRCLDRLCMYSSHSQKEAKK